MNPCYVAINFYFFKPPGIKTFPSIKKYIEKEKHVEILFGLFVSHICALFLNKNLKCILCGRQYVSPK